MRAVMAIRWTVAEWGRCYFWTFTYKEPVWFEEIAEVWKAEYKLLYQAFKRRYKLDRFGGIRVFEMHPGVDGGPSHGLHTHVLTPYYWDVNFIRAVVGRFGRLDVQARKSRSAEEAAAYASWYLGKYRHLSEFKLPKGTRVWAYFGNCPGKTRCKDVEVRSATVVVYQYLRSVDSGNPAFASESRKRKAWRLLRQARKILGDPVNLRKVLPGYVVAEVLEYLKFPEEEMATGPEERELYTPFEVDPESGQVRRRDNLPF